VNTIQDDFLKDKWKQTEANIKSEIYQVSQILETANSFKNEPEKVEKKNKEETKVINRDDINININVNNQKKLPNLNHFGGKLPFNQNNNNNNNDIFDNFKDMKNDYMNVNYDKINNNHNKNEDFVIHRKSISTEKNEKDPMVWDPPEEKAQKINFKPKINQNVNVNNNINKYGQRKISNPQKGDNKVGYGDFDNKGNLKKGNIENNMKNANIKNNPQKKDSKTTNPNNPNEKKTFLQERYPPNGVGPDSELIEMLEKEVVDKNPCVKFEDIAELDNAKNILKEAVLFPILMPQYFKGIRRPWKGVLLYGPPGTGKTMLAKALATQGKTTFFNVHSSSLASKWRGESEKLVRILFEMAKFYAPTTIFIDEVDSVGSKRRDNDDEASRKVKAELLVNMDGVNTSSSANANEQQEEEQRKIVMVLGATNRPWDLDDALRRRFEKRIYIPLPNEKGREECFKLNLMGEQLHENVDIKKLVASTGGYSGADIANVCREAALMDMRKKLLNNQGDFMDLMKDTNFKKELKAPINMDDFENALKNISKSVSNVDLQVYDKWTAEFKSN